MNFERSNSNAHNFGSAYKFAFGEDINLQLTMCFCAITLPLHCHTLHCHTLHCHTLHRHTLHCHTLRARAQDIANLNILIGSMLKQFIYNYNFAVGCNLGAAPRSTGDTRKIFVSNIKTATVDESHSASHSHVSTRTT